jgi:hypothetical protein
MQAHACVCSQGGSGTSMVMQQQHSGKQYSGQVALVDDTRHTQFDVLCCWMVPVKVSGSSQLPFDSAVIALYVGEGSSDSSSWEPHNRSSQCSWLRSNSGSSSSSSCIIQQQWALDTAMCNQSASAVLLV